MSDQLYPEGAASLIAPSGAAGVPVVDLTATTRGLYERADLLREQAHTLMVAATASITAARHFCETADQLEQVASVLDGGTGG